MINIDYEASPLKAIKQKCKYDCCAGDFESWKNCSCTSCMLHPFRFGTNPFRKKRTMSEEQKALIAEKMKEGREAKKCNK